MGLSGFLSVNGNLSSMICSSDQFNKRGYPPTIECPDDLTLTITQNLGLEQGKLRHYLKEKTCKEPLSLKRNTIPIQIEIVAHRNPKKNLWRRLEMEPLDLYQSSA